MSHELTTFNFEITSLQQAMDYAKLIADSDLAPKDYRGKAGNVLVAIQMGMEIGLKPLQAIQNIAVINGRPTIWGDAMMGIVQNHHLCEYIREEFKNDTAYCIVKRRGDNEEHISKFSREDAKKAGLIGKSGPWSQYPERMMQMRARGFALRDKFADVIKGIAMREEVLDYEDKKSRNETVRTKINQLIEGKSQKFSQFDEFKKMIDDATTIEELDGSKELAATLKDGEKLQARKIYSEKKSELNKKNNVEPEVITQVDDDKVALAIYEHGQFLRLKDQIINSTSDEELNIAADLIRSCAEKYHGDLLTFYHAKKEK